MARPVDKRKIYIQIAKQLGLKVSEVQEAAESQFSYVREVMKSDTFDQVRLPYFGRFWVKSGRLKYLQTFGKRVPNKEEDDS